MEPASGDWDITEPAGTVLLQCLVLLQTKPSASTSSQLVTIGTGTSTVHGPVEMTMLTVVPDWTMVPAGGSWLITVPMRAVLLQLWVVSHTSPAASMSAQPVAAGTDTSFVRHAPLESVSVTVAPAGTIAPASGDWLMTSPWDNASLQFWTSEHTRPAFMISSQLVAVGTVEGGEVTVTVHMRSDVPKLLNWTFTLT
jgi:hypothetical protein